MATTTNYSWTTPDDTALVKDGAAAIRSLGTAIDTTVFNNASAGIAKTIVDAKGDIIAATAADTVSRLAVGANDTVLTADSTAATGLKWATSAAGGMTLISTTALTGSSVTLSSIPQTYNSLFLLAYDMTNATANGFFAVNANTNTVSNRWSAVTNATAGADTGQMRLSGNQNLIRTDAGNAFQIRFDNYTSSSFYKPVTFSGSFDAADGNISIIGGGGFSNGAAITSLNIRNSGGNLLTGTVLLYGVK